MLEIVSVSDIVSDWVRSCGHIWFHQKSYCKLLIERPSLRIIPEEEWEWAWGRLDNPSLNYNLQLLFV